MENEILIELLRVTEENGALKKENEMLKREIDKLKNKYRKYEVGERLFGR